MRQLYPELGFFALGGHIADPQPLIEDVQFGERLGLGSVWLSERPGSKDIGVLCGAAAAAAPKLSIGAGLIANLPARNPMITASFASTMALLTTGKFSLGIGRGQDRLADMLCVPRSNLKVIERYLATMRALWRGDSVDAAYDGWSLKNANLGIILEAPPPVYMGAVGDKALEWAGKNVDGVILFSCLNAAAVSRSVSIVREAAEKAGRDPGGVEINAVAVTACDVSEEKMLNYVIRRMNTYFMWPVIDMLCDINKWDRTIANKIRAAVLKDAEDMAGALGDEGASRNFTHLKRMYDLYPQDWLSECNAIGSADNGAHYIKSLFDVGVDKVLLHGSPPKDFESLVGAWSHVR